MAEPRSRRWRLFAGPAGEPRSRRASDLILPPIWGFFGRRWLERNKHL